MFNVKISYVPISHYVQQNNFQNPFFLSLQFLKLNALNKYTEYNSKFHPLEVVFQVGEIYSYMFILRPNICKSRFLNTHISFQISVILLTNKTD